MGGQFPCIDLLIPLAYADAKKTVRLENMSYILISVRNLSGTSNDRLSQDYIDTETALGTSTADGEYIKPKSRSNLLLSLRTLLFIRRQDKPNSDDADRKDWIEVTEHNPYIAFVMSIGSGAIEGEKRFVPEKVFKACDLIKIG